MDERTAREAIREINIEANKKNVGTLALSELINMPKISENLYKLAKNGVVYVVRIDNGAIWTTVGR